jgi:hypothetical protein
MTTNQLRILYSLLFFLFIFLSGFWLSLSKRPYGVIVLTAHKLLSVAAVVFLVVVVNRVNQATKLDAVEWIAGIITGLFFLGTIITGGLLSAAKPMPTIVPMLHKITPYLTTLSTTVTLFLLLKKK